MKSMTSMKSVKRFLIQAVMLFLAVVAGMSASFAIMGEAMGNPFLPGEKITKTFAERFKVSEETVVTIADEIDKRDGYPDDVLTTFYLAELAAEQPTAFHKIRQDGCTWAKIMADNDIHPSRLFEPIPLNTTVPPLFKSAYQQYYRWKKTEKSPINLTDRDVRYLVGTKLVVSMFREDPLKVMQSFDNRITFTKIIYDRLSR